MNDRFNNTSEEEVSAVGEYLPHAAEAKENTLHGIIKDSRVFYFIAASVVDAKTKESYKLWQFSHCALYTRIPAAGRRSK